MKRYLSIGLALLTLGLLFVSWTSGGAMSEQDRREIKSGLLDIGEIETMEQSGLTRQEIAYLERTMFQGDMSPYGWTLAFRIMLVPDDFEQYLPIYPVFLIGSIMIFWLIAAGLLKVTIQHIFGRRPKGVMTFLLLLLVFGFFLIIADETPLILTPAPFIAVGAMLLSCMLWSSHTRKVGIKTGPYTLHERPKCPKCGAVQSEDFNMFCEKCKAAIDP